MCIRMLQTFIGKLKRKKPIVSRIQGLNNKVTYRVRGKDVGIKYISKKADFFIVGNNNTVIFSVEEFPSRDFCSGLSVEITGNYNVIEIKEPRFLNSKISISGDSNKFYLGKTTKSVNGASFFIESGGIFVAEDNCELGNYMLHVVVNGGYNTHPKLFIGEGTHIAKDAIIRTSDGECLLDYETGQPLSEPEDVYIGKHCWITSRCTILKGAYLPDNTIVGANSLVNKKFVEENTLIIGSPAKVKKTKVRWTEGPYDSVMKKLEKIKVKCNDKIS